MKTLPRSVESADFIDLTMSSSRVYWRHQLKVNDQELMDAIQAVGPEAASVRIYIEKQRHEWRGATI